MFPEVDCISWGGFSDSTAATSSGMYTFVGDLAGDFRVDPKSTKTDRFNVELNKVYNEQN